MKPSHVLTLNKLKELSLIFLVSLVTKTVLHEKAVGEFSLSCELKAKKKTVVCRRNFTKEKRLKLMRNKKE